MQKEAERRYVREEEARRKCMCLCITEINERNGSASAIVIITTFFFKDIRINTMLPLLEGS